MYDIFAVLCPSTSSGRRPWASTPPGRHTAEVELPAALQVLSFAIAEEAITSTAQSRLQRVRAGGEEGGAPAGGEGRGGQHFS